MPERLTAASVDRHCRAAGRTEVADLAAPGLVLRVNDGSAVFLYRWTKTRAGKKEKKRLTLGMVDTLPLAEARALAHRAADLSRQGFDLDDEWVRQQRSPAPATAVRRAMWNWSEAVDLWLFEIADPNDLAPAATASGADVSRIAREARRNARREKRAVTAGDLLAIAIPEDKLSERDRRLVAVHESGHAVAVMCAGRVPDVLSIISAGDNHGGVRGDHGIGNGSGRRFRDGGRHPPRRPCGRRGDPRRTLGWRQARP